MPHLPQLDPGSPDILAAANSPVLWLCTLGIFIVIGAQTAIYLVAVRRTAPAVGMSTADVRTSFRAGAVAAIGPSMAVALVAITLLSVFGVPGALARVGLIGSAAFEVAGAEIAANTQGVSLGGDGYTQSTFAAVMLSLSIAGSGWMIVTLIVTPLLKRGTARIASARTARATAAMATIPVAALLGAFVTFGIQQFQTGLAASIVTLTGAATMALCLWIARRTGATWLKEWGLGFALVVAIAVGILVGSAGIA